MPTLFINQEDYKLAINIVAHTVSLSNDISVIAFEIMSNHFHFLIKTQNSHSIESFETILRKKLARNFSDAQGMVFNSKIISEITNMRNTICYIHRNAYVVNNNYLPFTYPWSTGPYYFQNHEEGQSINNLTFKQKRKMFRSRIPVLPSAWIETKGYIRPDSFCDIKNGMSMFKDARQYLVYLTKNIESYRDIATEIGDDDFMTDEELYSQICRIIYGKYGNIRIKDLKLEQRFEIAREMHFKYHASNGQISRILRFPKYEVDNLFPGPQ